MAAAPNENKKESGFFFSSSCDFLRPFEASGRRIYYSAAPCEKKRHKRRNNFILGRPAAGESAKSRRSFCLRCVGAPRLEFAEAAAARVASGAAAPVCAAAVRVVLAAPLAFATASAAAALKKEQLQQTIKLLDGARFFLAALPPPPPPETLGAFCNWADFSPNAKTPLLIELARIGRTREEGRVSLAGGAANRVGRCNIVAALAANSISG